MKSSPGSGPYASVGAGGYTHCLMLPSFPPDASPSSQSARVFHFDKHGNGHAGMRTRTALCIFPPMPSRKRMFFFSTPPLLLYPHARPRRRQSRECSLTAPRQQGPGNQPHEGRAWSTERCRRHKHTRRHARSQTGMPARGRYSDVCAHTRAQAHTSRPRRECVRGSKRGLAVIYSSVFSCSQEATSPRSCKHTERQASVSCSPGNNKWSPHMNVHTTCGIACTNTYTRMRKGVGALTVKRQDNILPRDRSETKGSCGARRGFGR